MTALAESFEATVARGRRIAEAEKPAATLADAFLLMARAELNRGTNIAEIQTVVAGLTPHLSGTERATWWYGLKHAMAEADPACGVRPRPGFDPAVEDYDTPLTAALRALVGGGR